MAIKFRGKSISQTFDILIKFEELKTFFNFDHKYILNFKHNTGNRKK